MRWGSIAVVLASCAACTPALPLALPRVDGPKLLILAVEDSPVDPPVLFVGDPESLSLDLYVPLDGRTRLTALLYDRTADELDIPFGQLDIDPSYPRPLPQFSRAFQVTVGGRDAHTWAMIDELPPSLEDIRLPAVNVDRCFESEGCFDGQSCTHTCPLDQPDPPHVPDEPDLPNIAHALPCEPGEEMLALAADTLCLSDPCAHGCGTGIECPADGWPLVQEDPGIFFVDSEAIGAGDGTRAAPFRLVADAVASGAETIVLRDGTHSALGLQVLTPLTIVGGCLNTRLVLGFEIHPGAALTLKTLSAYVEADSKTDEGASLTSTEAELVIAAPTTTQGGRVELSASRLTLWSSFNFVRSTLVALDSRVGGLSMTTILAESSTISIARSIVTVTTPDLEGSLLSIEDTVLNGGRIDAGPAPAIKVAGTSRVELRRSWFENMSINMFDGEVAGEDVVVLHGGSNSWLTADNSSTVHFQRILVGAYVTDAPSIAVFGDAILSVGFAHVFGKSFGSAGRTHVDIAGAVFELAPGEGILLGGADVSISDLRARADEGLKVETMNTAQLNRVEITASATPANVDRTSTGLSVLVPRATLEDIRVQGAEHGMFVESQGLTMSRFDVRGVAVGATLVSAGGPLMLVAGYIEGEAQGVVLRDFGSTFISDLLQFVRVHGPIERD